MIHIRYKDLSVYTIVVTENWNEPLEQHPSIVERPQDFEVVDCELPEYVQYLTYQS